MKLLVVESPGKIAKLKPILESGWEIVATVGHFRDLPKNRFAVDKNTLRPQYQIQKEDVIRRLQAAIQRASEIYLATDPDREGEAIAWHILESCRIRVPCFRVTFGAITPSVVRSGISSPREINMPLVQAQEARRTIDRITGYLVSPALGTGRTAGRVQSPALRFLVERERQIQQFVPRKHFAVIAQAETFTAKWHFRPLLGKNAEKPYIWEDHSVAQTVSQTRTLKVHDFNKAMERRSPPPPFTTSTLQQLAVKALKMTVSQVMQAAQRLYEEGAITYHRTDSTTLSPEGMEELRAYLQKHSACCDPMRQWKAKKGAQEGHEGIRPAHIEIERPEASGERPFTPEALALYTLIRNRTLASQMPDALVEISSAIFVSANVSLNGKPVLFTGRGERILEHGWKSLALPDEPPKKPTGSGKDEPVGTFPELSKGQQFDCRCEIKEKMTEPPSRYTEDALVKKLEDSGIGRPSTYATIVSGIQSRGQAVMENKKLVPQAIAFEIVDTLVAHDFQFIEYKYTQIMEKTLDNIAEAANDNQATTLYNRCVRETWDALETDIARLPPPKGIDPLPGHGDACPECGDGEMKTFKVRKANSPNKGRRFLGCTNEACKHAVRPESEGWVAFVPPPELPGHGEPCPRCQSGAKTTRKVSKPDSPNKGKRYLSCSDRACNWLDMPESEGWEKRPECEPLPGHGETCPQCEKGTQKTFAVRKDGKNKGKRFAVCTRECGWKDYPASEGWN